MWPLCSSTVWKVTPHSEHAFEPITLSFSVAVLATLTVVGLVIIPSVGSPFVLSFLAKVDNISSGKSYTIPLLAWWIQMQWWAGWPYHIEADANILLSSAPSPLCARSIRYPNVCSAGAVGGCPTVYTVVALMTQAEKLIDDKRRGKTIHQPLT